VKLYTIGFTKKTAKGFFSLIKENGIDLLIDIRLNNKSQLAGFTKGEDLQYFLETICNCGYEHCDEFAPTKEMLDSYKKKELDWPGYEELYTELMKGRRDYLAFVSRFSLHHSVVLLCSEPTAEYCHRGLLSEMICDVSPNLILHHI
jgi:uncharacterized protein (DUF488 family)